MADNIAITEGSGKDVATDDVGGKQYQRIKLDLGTDGATAPALAGAGAVATGVQRITLASDDPAVALLGTIDTDTGNMVTALQLLDNAVDGNYLNVNANIAGVDFVGGAGAVAAGVQRITLASNDPGVALLATIDSDTNDIKTAIELLDNAVDGNYLNVNLNFAGTDAQIGEGIISASTLRVTLATDDDAVVHLATIAGDTTSIDGKITACNTGAVVISSGTITTVSTVTSLSQLGGQAINLGEGVIATGTQRVTLATDDDSVASLGIIDDWDATHASAASADGPQIMGAGYSAALPTDIGADGDAARICTDRHGRIVRGLMPQWFNAVFDSANASAEANVVKAGTASRKIYILSITISVDAEMWVKLQDEDSNAITPKFWLKAGGGLVKTYPPEAPLVLNVVNKALEVITEGAGNIGVEVTGYLAV